MLKAILHHAILFFTLKHNGRNLPKSIGFSLALLLFSAASTYLRLEITGAAPSGQALAASLIGAVVIFTFTLNNPALMAAVSIPSLVGNLGIVAASDIPPLRFAIAVWQMLAIYFAIKAVQSQEAEA